MYILTAFIRRNTYFTLIDRYNNNSSKYLNKVKIKALNSYVYQRGEKKRTYVLLYYLEL